MVEYVEVRPEDRCAVYAPTLSQGTAYVRSIEVHDAIAALEGGRAEIVSWGADIVAQLWKAKLDGLLARLLSLDWCPIGLGHVFLAGKARRGEGSRVCHVLV